MRHPLEKMTSPCQLDAEWSPYGWLGPSIAKVARIDVTRYLLWVSHYVSADAPTHFGTESARVVSLKFLFQWNQTPKRLWFVKRPSTNFRIFNRCNGTWTLLRQSDNLLRNQSLCASFNHFSNKKMLRHKFSRMTEENRISKYWMPNSAFF